MSATVLVCYLPLNAEATINDVGRCGNRSSLPLCFVALLYFVHTKIIYLISCLSISPVVKMVKFPVIPATTTNALRKAKAKHTANPRAVPASRTPASVDYLYNSFFFHQNFMDGYPFDISGPFVFIQNFYFHFSWIFLIWSANLLESSRILFTIEWAASTWRPWVSVGCFIKQS